MFNKTSIKRFIIKHFTTKDKPYRPYDISLDKAAYVCGTTLIAIGILYSIAYFGCGFDMRDYTIPCMLNLLTGYYCPGCGGTRAVIALLHGHLLDSLYYNPFVLFTITTGGWFMLSQKLYRLTKTRHLSFKPMTLKPWHLYTATILLTVQCLIKNLVLFLFDYHML